MKDVNENMPVNCCICRKQIVCPKDMIKDVEKHLCFECFQNSKGLSKLDFSKVHVDIPTDKLEDMMPEMITNELMENIFPEMWRIRKNELKQLSKKDLAKEAFGEGVFNAVNMMIQNMKEGKLKKEK